jgi:hypothetical protein
MMMETASFVLDMERKSLKSAASLASSLKKVYVRWPEISIEQFIFKFYMKAEMKSTLRRCVGYEDSFFKLNSQLHA